MTNKNDDTVDTSEDPVGELIEAIRRFVALVPQSGDIALMVRASQSGGDDAAKRADALVKEAYDMGDRLRELIDAIDKVEKERKSVMENFQNMTKNISTSDMLLNVLLDTFQVVDDAFVRVEVSDEARMLSLVSEKSVQWQRDARELRDLAIKVPQDASVADELATALCHMCDDAKFYINVRSRELCEKEKKGDEHCE